MRRLARCFVRARNVQFAHDVSRNRDSLLEIENWTVAFIFVFQAEAISCARRTVLNPFFTQWSSLCKQVLPQHLFCCIFLAQNPTIFLAFRQFFRPFLYVSKVELTASWWQEPCCMSSVFYQVVSWKRNIKLGTFLHRHYLLLYFPRKPCHFG